MFNSIQGRSSTAVVQTSSRAKPEAESTLQPTLPVTVGGARPVEAPPLRATVLQGLPPASPGDRGDSKAALSSAQVPAEKGAKPLPQAPRQAGVVARNPAEPAQKWNAASLTARHQELFDQLRVALKAPVDGSQVRISAQMLALYDDFDAGVEAGVAGVTEGSDPDVKRRVEQMQLAMGWISAMQEHMFPINLEVSAVLAERLISTIKAIIVQLLTFDAASHHKPALEGILQSLETARAGLKPRQEPAPGSGMTPPSAPSATPIPSRGDSKSTASSLVQVLRSLPEDDKALAEQLDRLEDEFACAIDPEVRRRIVADIIASEPYMSNVALGMVVKKLTSGMVSAFGSGTIHESFARALLEPVLATGKQALSMVRQEVLLMAVMDASGPGMMPKLRSAITQSALAPSDRQYLLHLLDERARLSTSSTSTSEAKGKS